MQKNNQNQFEELLSKVQEILGSDAARVSAGELITNVITATETEPGHDQVCTLIARQTNLDLTDARVESIYRAICEKPFEQTYQPFNNPFFEKLRQSLSEEPSDAE
jgi:hypothetical protein